MPEPGTRTYDIVLLGATGFTGELTARYLAEHAPEGCRWALAGRNRTKLAAVRSRLGKVDPGLAELPLVEADSTDEASLAALAASTRVVITTVGPYLTYGGPLVAACAAAGTDYLDLTGEPEFVDRSYLDHHETAVASGARIVHAAGFDSIPYDLGVWFTLDHLPADVPISIRGVVRAGGKPSGGTLSSALTAMSRPRQMRAAMAERRAKEGRPEGRRSRARAGKPHRDADLGLWLVPLPTIDPFVVARSGAANDKYGPDFSYSHFAGLKKLPTVLVSGAVVGAFVASAQVPPLRKVVASRITAGEGPSEQRRRRSWFRLDLVAQADDPTSTRVHTRVSGGDPGYDETAKMLAESALCLAFDDNPRTAGQVTTATAMGDRLLQRLIDAGIRFEVVSKD